MEVGEGMSEGGQCLTPWHFRFRQRPQPAPQAFGRTLHQPHTAIVQLHLPVDRAHGQRPAWPWCRQFICSIFPPGNAVSGKGATRTVGAGTGADRRTQIHLRLGVVRHHAFILRQQPLRQRPQPLLYRPLARPTLDAEQATQHPFHIAVQNRFTPAIRLRHDGCGGGATNAGQRLPAGPILRKTALCHDLPRGPVQIACPGVVAQPLPQGEHCIRLGIRQRLHRGQGRHEALEIGHHRPHLRLLQHDLRHPHPIGRARLLPRQIVPPMFGIPCQQPGRKACFQRGLPHFCRHSLKPPCENAILSRLKRISDAA